MGEVIFSFIILIGFVVLFFLPTLIASNKAHPRSTSIFVLNIIGGWTGILWIAALIWAMNEDW